MTRQTPWEQLNDSSENGRSVQNADGGRLLVLVSNEADALAMGRAVRQAAPGLTIVVSRDGGGTGAVSGSFDVTAIDISGGAGRAVASGLDRRARNPGEEIVFFCEDVRMPELAAVRALGISPIAAGAGSRAWLVLAAPTLIRVARARRDLRSAELSVPRFVSGGDVTPDVPLPLPLAEQRFRETYLRGLVAGAGNRARAAVHAGIPYRTLCKALQTLEIPVPPGPSTQLPASHEQSGETVSFLEVSPVIPDENAHTVTDQRGVRSR